MGKTPAKYTLRPIADTGLFCVQEKGATSALYLSAAEIYQQAKLFKQLDTVSQNFIRHILQAKGAESGKE